MRIGIVAGEASGDSLGAGLMNEMINLYPDIRFEGIFGPKMEKITGNIGWASSEELSVMGVLEPLKILPKLLRLRGTLVKRWSENPPDIFIGIDAPEFNLSLEKKLHKRGIKTVHYVSPSIWAWRKNRIKTIRKSVDKVLCLLPFEPDLYHAYGVPAVFVGHPLVKKLPYEMKKYTARKKLQIPSETVIAVLPGSRLSEIKKLGPIFARVAKLIVSQNKKISFVSPMASQSTYDQFENILLSNNIRSAFNVIKGYSHEAMIAADIVLLASGTAALESALLFKPTVAAYKVSALSYFILNKLVKTSYFTLPNILLNKEIIPEFIQNKASDINLFDSISECLYNKHYQQNMINNFTQLKSQLDADTDKLAASEVLKLL